MQDLVRTFWRREYAALDESTLAIETLRDGLTNHVTRSKKKVHLVIKAVLARPSKTVALTRPAYWMEREGNTQREKRFKVCTPPLLYPTES